MTENEIAKIAIDIFYKIHRKLGPGLLESVYESAFAYELDKLKIPYQRQVGIQAVYEAVVLDVAFRADIVIDNKVIIEFKSVEHLDRVHHKIFLTYLKLSGFKLGLLVNFNVPLIKDGIFRKINGYLDK